MRRGGPQHPKVILLAAALGLPRYAAVGLLECLWHFTATYAPHGDVGRYDDQAIATAIGWERAPEELVETLLRCRFLDPHERSRFLVHDWNVHADQTTQRIVSRSGTTFVAGRKPTRKEASQKLARNYPRIASGGRRAYANSPSRALRQNLKKSSLATTLLGQAATETSRPEAMLIAEINRVGNRSFSVRSKANLAFAHARLVDYPLAELLAMVRWRWRTWDEGMRAQWFRPETLLNATKCESYMGTMPASERAGGPRPVAKRNPELDRIAALDRELGRG